MIDAVHTRKNPTGFICFGMHNLSNFAVVKSLRNFGGGLVDNNTFFFWKQVLSFKLFLILSRQLWNFQINIMFEIVGSMNVMLSLFSVWNFGWNILAKLWSMICCGCFLSSKNSFSFFNRFSLLLVTILTIRFAKVSHTSGISEILHIIMKPSLAMISHIAKDSFGFKNRLNKQSYWNYT